METALPTLSLPHSEGNLFLHHFLGKCFGGSDETLNGTIHQGGHIRSGIQDLLVAHPYRGPLILAVLVVVRVAGFIQFIPAFTTL